MEKFKKIKMLRILVEIKEAFFAIICTAVLAAGLYLGYTLGKAPVNYFVHGLILDDLYDNYTDSTNLSDDVTFFENGQHGYITGASGKKVLRNVKKVMVPDNGHLAWYMSKGFRGFFDVRTGEAVIPAKYKKAWFFSKDGMACVMKEDSTLEFIDTLGNVVITSNMMSNLKYDESHKQSYMFHDGHCPIKYKGKVNLINSKGVFVLPVFYESIMYDNGFWIAKDSSLCKVYESKTMKELDMPMNCIDVKCSDNTFIIGYSDGTQVVADFEGKIQFWKVYNEVERLTYEDGYGNIENAECIEYEINGKYGLLDANLRKITPPVYDHISALDRTHYKCRVASKAYIILNNKGEVIE